MTQDIKDHLPNGAYLGTISTLSTEYFTLYEKTKDACRLSYSPYSNFKVGACLYTNGNDYIQGANIENASYGACICAEQTAIVKALTSGFSSFQAIGVCAEGAPICAPCGICRQVIREFAPNIDIYLFGTEDTYVKISLSHLLPLSFGPEDLA